MTDDKTVRVRFTDQEADNIAKITQKKPGESLAAAINRHLNNTKNHSGVNTNDTQPR